MFERTDHRAADGAVVAGVNAGAGCRTMPLFQPPALGQRAIDNQPIDKK